MPDAPLAIQMLHDRILIKMSGGPGERTSRGGILIPATAEADQAHDYYLEMLAPERMYAAHVSLITHGRRTCHAQRPDCEHCPLAPRCRYFDPKAE